jgi:hypothetical protein
MRAFHVAVVLSAALMIQPAHAQTEDDVTRLEASMAAAQAQAARPGDEDLNCEALEAEMIALMQAPEVEARFAAMGAQGQEMQQDMNEAQRRARARMAAHMFMGMAAGIASSFVPGAGYATMMAQRAQMAEQQRQAEQNRERVSSMMGNLEPIMPQLMRGQRVYELGQARQCAFVQEESLPQ